MDIESQSRAILVYVVAPLNHTRFCQLQNRFNQLPERRHFTCAVLFHCIFPLTCPWSLRPHQRWEVSPSGRLLRGVSAFVTNTNQFLTQSITPPCRSLERRPRQPPAFSPSPRQPRA